MRKMVVTYNFVEGYHNWEGAPKEFEYLSSRHRHMFAIRCRFEVTHNDREIEINKMQQDIERLFESSFRKPCEFGSRSCEDICEALLSEYSNLVEVEVLEDGFGGAIIQR